MFVWACNSMAVILTSDFSICLLVCGRRRRDSLLTTKIALGKENGSSRKAKWKFATGSAEIIADTYAYRSPSPGSALVSTAPCTHHPGEHSHPCIAGSLSEEAHCKHCNSSHTLERKSTLDQRTLDTLVPAAHVGGHSLWLGEGKWGQHQRCQISEL